MNAFDGASMVEARGMTILLPFLEERAEGACVVKLAKGRLARFLQATIGDVVFNERDTGALVSVEIKVEQRWTGNLFLETWSNRNLENPQSHADRGSNPGWLYKCRADALLYYFLDTDKLITCSVFALKRWAFAQDGENTDQWGKPLVGRIWDFPEAPQGRYSQLNDTRGRLVPISVLRDEIGAKRIEVRQLHLPETGG